MSNYKQKQKKVFILLGVALVLLTIILYILYITTNNIIFFGAATHTSTLFIIEVIYVINELSQ
jgi:hypothetical protein